MLGNVVKTSEARAAQASLLACITEPKRFWREAQNCVSRVLLLCLLRYDRGWQFVLERSESAK